MNTYIVTIVLFLINAIVIKFKYRKYVDSFIRLINKKLVKNLGVYDKIIYATKVAEIGKSLKNIFTIIIGNKEEEIEEKINRILSVCRQVEQVLHDSKR